MRSAAASVEASAVSTNDGMVWIPGGTFRMGSNQHHSEEAPGHWVSVDGFWIDRTPVTNRDFHKFVTSTGDVTMAEVPLDPKNYPAGLQDPPVVHVAYRLLTGGTTSHGLS